jgi:bacterioferritin-associated ferredoxin
VYACICRAVTTDEVSAAIDEGAATVKAVAKATRACTLCGMCRVRISSMLAERSAECPVHALPATA